MLAEGTMQPNLAPSHLRIRRERTGSAEGRSKRQAVPGRTFRGSATLLYPRLNIARPAARPSFLRVGSSLRLVQVVAEGAMPKDPRRRSQAHRRRRTEGSWCTEVLLCAEGGPTWRITVTSATPVTALTVASWRQSVAAPSCTKEESRSVKSEQAAKQEISLGAMRSDP